MPIVKEFREFIARGNVIDLAVAVIIGASFGNIVKSLTDDIMMPLIGMLTGGLSGLNFTDKFIPLNGDFGTYKTLAEAKTHTAVLAYGSFLTQGQFTKERKRKGERIGSLWMSEHGGWTKGIPGGAGKACGLEKPQEGGRNFCGRRREGGSVCSFGVEEGVVLRTVKTPGEASQAGGGEKGRKDPEG